MDHDPDCKACRANARAIEHDAYLVWRNDLWVLRHARPPYPMLGWMTLHSRRHAPAFTLLSPGELADLGPVMAAISQALLDTTGALRVYIASMTEMTPHFHAHLLPRYADAPKGWAAFRLKEQAATDPPVIGDDTVFDLIAAVGDRLRRRMGS